MLPDPASLYRGPSAPPQRQMSHPDQYYAYPPSYSQTAYHHHHSHQPDGTTRKQQQQQLHQHHNPSQYSPPSPPHAQMGPPPLPQSRRSQPGPARKQSASSGNRPWSDDDESFLLRSRAQKMPYKAIAAHLSKTELACRLHFHQLTRGSSRRRHRAASRPRSLSPYQLADPLGSAPEPDEDYSRHYNPGRTVAARYPPPLPPHASRSDPGPYIRRAALSLSLSSPRAAHPGGECGTELASPEAVQHTDGTRYYRQHHPQAPAVEHSPTVAPQPWHPTENGPLRVDVAPTEPDTIHRIAPFRPEGTPLSHPHKSNQHRHQHHLNQFHNHHQNHIQSPPSPSTYPSRDTSSEPSRTHSFDSVASHSSWSSERAASRYQPTSVPVQSSHISSSQFPQFSPYSPFSDAKTRQQNGPLPPVDTRLPPLPPLSLPPHSAVVSPTSSVSLAMSPDERPHDSFIYTRPPPHPFCRERLASVDAGRNRVTSISSLLN